LKAEKTHIGRDIEIWPDSTEGWDSGQLAISPYTVEVKFTSSSRVRISRVQSETARSNKENYIVLVVKNANTLRDRLKVKLSENDVSKTLINDVIKTSHVVENFYTKLGAVPNPYEVEPDIHGYWIKQQLWGDKENITQWLERANLR